MTKLEFDIASQKSSREIRGAEEQRAHVLFHFQRSEIWFSANILQLRVVRSRCLTHFGICIRLVLNFFHIQSS